jgi:CBS domain-containing protein
MDQIREIMATDVVTVPPELPVAELSSLLDRAGITGAPVVDAEGSLVGVVTVRDVMRLVREVLEVPEAARWGIGVPLPEGWEAGNVAPDIPADTEFHAYFVTPGGGFVDVRDRIRQLPTTALEGYRVKDIMTRDPVTVPPRTGLDTLARLLVDQGIHRALVVEEGRLVGIVSATDLLRAVAEGRFRS